MGITGGESLPCTPLPSPTRCSWHCRDYKLHPHGLAAPGDWHRAPCTVPSNQTLPPAPSGHLPPHAAAPMRLAKFGPVLPVPPTYPHLYADSPVPAMQREDCPTAGCGSSACCHCQVWGNGTACLLCVLGPCLPLMFAEQQGSPCLWPISPNTPVSVLVVWTGLHELLQKASSLWGKPRAFMGSAAGR